MIVPVLGLRIVLFRRPMGEAVTNSTIVLPVQPISATTVSLVRDPKTESNRSVRSHRSIIVGCIPMGVPMHA